ncbi:MAG: formate dehydrogenase subunit gamma [Gammaproteobacteria bacterium]
MNRLSSRLRYGVLIALLLICALLTVQAADDAALWRQVHDGIAGYSAVNGQETGVLIQRFGDQWQRLRSGLIAGVGAWGLALTLFAIACFFLFKGPVKLQQPRTGELVERWSVYERYLHLVTAFLFLMLMFTGLVLLYGRRWLLPFVEPANFSVLAQWAKIIHNYSGPLFVVALALMFVCWFKDNLPRREDLQWLKALGGIVGNRHPSAGRMNAGEKLWFWLLMSVGLLLIGSGLMLDFPVFGQSRQLLQYSHLLHTVSAFLLMIAAIGHIYIGTLGTEGAFEGMKTGKVDVSWAKQHHDLWLESLQHKTGQSEK